MTKHQYPDPFSDIPDATEDGAVIDVLYADENTPFVFLGLDGVHTWKPTKRERETAKRRELGLCIKCGKPSAPKATCAECGRKANEARKRRKAAE